MSDIEYKFQIPSPPGYDCFQGEVVTIKSVCTDGKDRRIEYTDDDSSDMSLVEIKRCPKVTKKIYAPTRRSKRKSFVNITVEGLIEVNQTLQRLKVQKSQVLTLDRTIQVYEKNLLHKTI